MNRVEAGIPDQVTCADCVRDLQEPFGWCSNCRAAYCLDCGEGHYCLPVCKARGCLAGFCIRTVSDGEIGPWKVPTVRMEGT
jgi:hypothetical protein